MFGKKQTQLEKDQAFLAAVGAHKFSRARKLVKNGANPRAVDASGNTAMHYLTGAEKYVHQSEVSEFIDFLCQHKLDLNACNKAGQSCVQLISNHSHGQEIYNPTIVDALSFFGGVNRCNDAVLMSILFERGVDLTVTDKAGRTLLHSYAAMGNKRVVRALIRNMPQLLHVRDSRGDYPHMSATAGMIKFVALADEMESLFKIQSVNMPVQKNEAAQAPASAPVPSAAVLADENWVLLDKPSCVASVSHEPVIGYRLTEVFNFARNTCTRITHNLETRTDSSDICSFDDYPDKAMVDSARQALLRLTYEAGRHKTNKGP